MAVFLRGLEISFFRGIGQVPQRMQEFKEFNFFIGANNSGKSTILDFVSRYLPLKQNNSFKSSQRTTLDAHRGEISGQTSVAFPMSASVLLNKLRSGARNEEKAKTIETYAKPILEVFAEDGDVWFFVDRTSNDQFRFLKQVKNERINTALGYREWEQLWSALKNMTGGGPQAWIADSLDAIQKALSVAIPETRLIPAIRQISAKGFDFADFTGQGLIDKLAELQSPDHDKREDREKFDQITRFVQLVLDRPNSRIEIPHNREHVLVHSDNKVLPISALGTGIHEVIMLASFCTLFDNVIMCIEEPEIHLHPVLQKKFIRYLREFTNNQYFISTHSARFIDTVDAAIFHVRNDGRTTTIEETLLRKKKFEVCMDLGYRASDIIQSNCVIWVEGPSDRVYLNHWIASVDKTLKEGIHYSVMYYGGRILSHLTADPEELDEFINLKSLNQNTAIIIDSDRPKKGAAINATKARIRDNFLGSDELCWITKGREIENYIEHSVLQEAVEALYANSYGAPSDGGIYDHSLYYVRSKPKRTRAQPKTAASSIDGLVETVVDKVGVAKLVCAKPANLDVLDLRQRIDDIVSFIAKANG